MSKIKYSTMGDTHVKIPLQIIENISLFDNTLRLRIIKELLNHIESLDESAKDWGYLKKDLRLKLGIKHEANFHESLKSLERIGLIRMFSYDNKSGKPVGIILNSDEYYDYSEIINYFLKKHNL